MRSIYKHKKPKRIARKEMAQVYATILRGNLKDDEVDNFVYAFNRLIRDYWSFSGLHWIKVKAWKIKL